MVKKEILNTIKKWEYANIVYGKGYVDKTVGNGKSLSDNMQRRGYDAMRVSPSMTTKFGLKYRKVYGTQIEPNYSMASQGSKMAKFYPKVKWFLQGYIKAGKSKGTVILNRSILRDFQLSPLKSLLMIRKK